MVLAGICYLVEIHVETNLSLHFFNSLLHKNEPWKIFLQGSLEWMDKDSAGGAVHDEGNRFCFHWRCSDQHIGLLTISDPWAAQQSVDQGQGVVFSLAMDVIVVQCQCNAHQSDDSGNRYMFSWQNMSKGSRHKKELWDYLTIFPTWGRSHQSQKCCYQK